ncbi:hypothetical protein KBB96_03305 [Luteolibacter ambystomatis]|uniref:RHS repeat-associated core domain-containing protein n=1 Tax=Luteolibacter ambystomatis TaxID=2824561 RepID=A0A975J0S4_9BACT|nr:RHS repeat-associated core domain-containing protein [Luteolibacter ambystomatis]QUE51922.1 hypothetical protein KBB96_03305 [Luteolibacter ambystomatis]
MTTNSKNKTTKHAIVACVLGLAGAASANTSEKYVYDASGNMVEKTINGAVTRMSYDASNQLISTNKDGREEAYFHDTAGCLQNVVNATGEKIRFQTTGYAGKVLELNSSGLISKLFYNSEGQLVGKITGGDSTNYAWDGYSLAMDGSHVFTNEGHISGGVPLLIDGGEVVISDYLGNTLSSGTTQFDGSAYGDGFESGRYTGKAYIAELDSYVFKHRLYSSSIAKWNMPDPSGYPDGANNNIYACGDPISRIDADGLISFTTQTPSPSTFTQPGGSKVDTAMNAVAHENRNDTKNVIDTKYNPTVLPANKLLMKLSTLDRASDTVVLKTSGDSAFKADGGASNAGVNIETVETFGLANGQWESIQTILSNVAGPTANAVANSEYLDNNNSTTCPFYAGTPPGSPTVRDFPRRDWPTSGKTTWKAYIVYGDYMASTKEFYSDKNAGIKYGFTLE